MKFIKRTLLSVIIFSLASCASPATQPPAASKATLAPPSITTIPLPSETGLGPTPESLPEVVQYGLSGRLVLIRYDPDGNRLIELNLQTGEIKTLFQAPPNSWLSEAAVSPDNRQILLTYAPPPSADKPQFGYSDLYLLPYDGTSQPQPFITRNDPDESFFFPAWAPDGQSIYLTHLHKILENEQVPAYQNDVERATLDGVLTPIIAHALWPALSPDGTRLAYLYADPVTFGNDLYLANPDGTGQTPVLQPGVNPPVDAHLFTSDGSQLIFSMVNAQPAPTSSWLDKLFGAQVASAHGVPSDWYEAPISGGTPQALTRLGDVNLNGDLSPDGSRMAFISASGLFTMNIDGSNLVLLSSDVVVGTVNWIQ